MKGLHMKQHRFFTLLFLSILFLISGCVYFTALKKPALEPATNIQLASIFSDNMVLQQKKNCPVWGTADPEGKVTVQFNNQKKETIVGVNGDWKVEFSPIKAGGPFELTIFGKDSTMFKNVMVGEVWICSGQSNMQWTVSNSANAEEEIKNAQYPNIRLFTVQRNVSPKPISELTSEGWQDCTPKTIPEFSAVGYFFGKHLHEKLNVPIGLINTSWGGTPVESWTSQKTLKMLPDFLKTIEEIEALADSLSDVHQDYKEKNEIFQKELNEWKENFVKLDKGLAPGVTQWHDAGLELDNWQQMELPEVWEKAGLAGFDGVVWFRKEVEIPISWKGQSLKLNLGPINDEDITWFNGVQVGSTKGHTKLRHYEIPEFIFRVGKNVLAVRVFDYGNNGGLWGENLQYHLDNENGESIQLSGEWIYQTSVNMSDVPKPMAPPVSPSHTPSFLYNAMIYPLIPYSIQGAIWYQGESNAGRAYQYRSLFSSMITDWRESWNQGEFPFLFVQLANFMQVKPEPVDDNWAELREAQTMALSLPNTGMAVTIDIGEADDIHPKNKQDVGKRLALNARKIVYGEKVPHSGPIYKSMKIKNDKIILDFDFVYRGLKTKGDEKLNGFAIAGADGKFYWADAEIQGDQVVVSSPKVANPIAVRYAWSSNPVCNLYNSAGLPASPFRTDDWQGITFGKK
jgi:sialate O-acetylesterase